MKKIPLKLTDNILNAIGNAVLITDVKNKIVYINRHYTEITGYTPDDVIGKSPSILSSGKQNKEFYQQLWTSLQSTGYWEGEIWNRKKSGELFPEWINISAVKNHKNRIIYYIGIFSDITHKKEMEEKIVHYAYYDPLTNLSNRRFFIEQLNQQMTLAKRKRQKIAVLFLDLDDFKTINDHFGHLTGDLYLCEVARLIKSQLRESDIISRFGGDEFVIELPDIKSKAITIQYCKKLLSSLEKTLIQVANHPLQIKVSLGYAIYPDDALQAESLIQCADMRMYKVKAAKK